MKMDMLKDVLAMLAVRSRTRRRKRRGDWRGQPPAVRRRSPVGRPAVAGIGLAAAAVAVAVTATASSPRVLPAQGEVRPSAAPPPGTIQPRRNSPVQQMLLTPPRAPSGPRQDRAPTGMSGRAATGNGNKLYLPESWTKRDGQTWTGTRRGHAHRAAALPAVLGPFFGRPGAEVPPAPAPPGYPAALTRWILTNAARHGSKSGGPVPGKAEEREHSSTR